MQLEILKIKSPTMQIPYDKITRDLYISTLSLFAIGTK